MILLIKMNSRINLDNQSAIVLHRYNYRDSSLIIDFFLSDFGRVSAIAKGVKSNKSKHNQSILLQPFKKLKVSLTGKGDLLILKNVELTTELTSDSTVSDWDLSGKALYCAYYLNELLLRLLPSNTDCHLILTLYEQALSLLSCTSGQQAKHFEMPLRIFELKLLEYLGYGLNLSHDSHTGMPVEQQKQYYYLIDSGPIETPVEGIRNLAIRGKTLLDLAEGQFSDQKTLQECKQLLKWALAEHLGDKPLKSRNIFKQLYCSTVTI